MFSRKKRDKADSNHLRECLSGMVYLSLELIFARRHHSPDRHAPRKSVAMLAPDSPAARHLTHGLDMAQSPGGLTVGQLLDWSVTLVELVKDSELRPLETLDLCFVCGKRPRHNHKRVCKECAP